MDDLRDARESARHRLRVADVPLDHLDVADVVAASARKVVEDPDVGAAGDELRHEVRADEAAPAGYEDRVRDRFSAPRALVGSDRRLLGRHGRVALPDEHAIRHARQDIGRLYARAQVAAG